MPDSYIVIKFECLRLQKAFFSLTSYSRSCD